MNEPISHCPFCGEELSVCNVPWSDGTPGYELWHVRHKNIKTPSRLKCPLAAGCYGTEEEAIEAANMRYGITKRSDAQ